MKDYQSHNRDAWNKRVAAHLESEFYNCFEGMKQLDERKFIIEKHGNKLPLVYSLIATKK